MPLLTYKTIITQQVLSSLPVRTPDKLNLSIKPMGYQVSYPGWIIKLYLNFTHQIFSHAKNVKTRKAVTSWIFMDFPMLQFFPMVLYNSWFKIFQSKMRTFFYLKKFYVSMPHQTTFVNLNALIQHLFICTVQQWRLSGQRSSLGIFKDSQPVLTQVQISLNIL